MDQLVAIRWRELGKRLLASSIPRAVHDLLKGVDVHEYSFRYHAFNIQRLTHFRS